MNTSIRSMLCAAVVAAGAGCADRPYQGPLRGDWALSLTLESALPGRAAPRGTAVTGSVVVPDPTPINPRAFPQAAPADVRLDLAPFGLRITPRSQPVVRDLGRGAVRIDLASVPEQLVLVGRLAGDSAVTGMWYHEFRAGGASGRFVMRRTPLISGAGSGGQPGRCSGTHATRLPSCGRDSAPRAAAT